MTPEDSGQVLALVRSELANIATTIPAIVLRHDRNRQVVDVELVVKRPYFGNDSGEDQPIRLINVPLIYPQGSDWVIAGPIKKGDAVLIHCSMFDCETWMIGDKDKVYQAGSKYYHDINSAFATTGAFTYNSPTRDPRFKDKFHMVQGNNYLTMENGKVVISCTDSASTITMEGGKVTITTDGVTEINSSHTTINNNSTINGNLNVTGTVFAPTLDASNSLKVSGKEMNGHSHGGVESGSSSTNPF